MLLTELFEEKKELLAPNGKPSNLSPEHYKLVRSAKFKKWFGDWEKDPESASKIVDANGEPLVCYHISGVEGIKTFKPSWRGIIFFAKTEAGARTASTQGQSYLYKAFLNVRKPKGSAKPGAGMYFGDAENKKNQEKMRAAGYDGINVRDEAKGTVAVFDDSQIMQVT